LKSAGWLLGSSALLPSLPAPSQADESSPRWRVAIIGHTGQGDYGHGHDAAFREHPGFDLVAVADADEAGRAKARERLRAPRAYASYEEMLTQEHPALVAIAPRQSAEHHAMASAALKAGAHLLLEKPFTVTMAEADSLLALAQERQRRIAVAHQMRLSPAIQNLHRRLQEKWLGRLISLRAHGKQDSRAGGEDLIVLGTHLFDLMRLLAGDPLWCRAEIRSRSHPVTRADIRPATENIGPILGDEIEAQFGFADGVSASFTSRAALRETLGHWGMTLLCEKGLVRILMDVDPHIVWRRTEPSGKSAAVEPWEAVPGDPTSGLPATDKGFPAANRRVLADLLEAIAQKRDPVCSGAAGAKALEMALAIFEAGLSGTRASFPLKNRAHPLQ
jgi:predicted dehydrogenase